MIAFDPGQVAQPTLVRHGDDGDVAGTGSVGVWTNAQEHALTGGGLEEAVDAVRGANVAAVHRQQILTVLYVDARLRERRPEIGIPIFAVVNARKPIAAILDSIVASEETGGDGLGFWHIPSAHAK